MERFGVILAGGAGERLRPTTYALNKHLLPVYDKPMLMLAIDFMLEVGVKRLAVVTNKHDMLAFTELLTPAYPKSNFYIVEQDNRKGVAAALASAQAVAYGHPTLVMLGDNLFHGPEFLAAAKRLYRLKELEAGCLAVESPRAAHDSCVITFADNGHISSLTEKPKKPKSHWVVPGLYAYPPGVFDALDDLRPSARGELEITDLNVHYLNQGRLSAVRVLLDGENQWFDMGNHDKLLKASMLRYATHS